MVWIARIDIGSAVLAKINSKHGISEDDVIEACYRYQKAVFHVHPEYGRRLLVSGTTASGRTLKIVLQPVDVEIGWFRLRTAFVK